MPEPDPAMAGRPMIFVASSSEQLETANEIGRGLDSADWKVRVWHTQVALSAADIESLERALARADFAVVVMTGDDASNVRQGALVLPRDNVVFELGLFIGRLGRERCAFFHDASASKRIASDLEGVKGADFYPTGLADDRARPSLSVRIRQVKGQIRTVLAKSGPRYKPDAAVRALQQRRWHFLRRIEGPWWERMRTGDDDASALSQVTISADPTTTGCWPHGTRRPNWRWTASRRCTTGGAASTNAGTLRPWAAAAPSCSTANSTRGARGAASTTGG